jgi:hypothetical protein
MKKTNLVLAIAAAAVIVGMAGRVHAQTQPPTKNIFVDVNFGAQPSSRTLSVQALPVVYNEIAIIQANQEINGASFMDIEGGYRVWRDFSVVLGLTSTFSTKGTAEVTGGIPHPIFYDTRVESRVSVADLSHREQSAHISFMWTSPVTDKIDASIMAGPSFIKVYQDLVSGVNVPLGTQTFTPISETQTATKAAFHIGGDITYLITPMYGVGGLVRFVKAKADLPSVPDLDIAGFQVGGGFRIRFNGF